MSPCRKSANSWPHVLTAGLWLWKWGVLISRISAPIFFPVFSYPFLDRFFTYTTRRFQRRTIILYLIKTNWPLLLFINKKTGRVGYIYRIAGVWIHTDPTLHRVQTRTSTKDPDQVSSFSRDPNQVSSFFERSGSGWQIFREVRIRLEDPEWEYIRRVRTNEKPVGWALQRSLDSICG